MRRPVVIGSSLGSESDLVVKAGVAVARTTRSPVRLVHVLQPFLPFGPAEVGWVVNPQWEADLGNKLRTLLDRQASSLGVTEIPGSSVEVIDGDPDRVLAELTRDEAAQLLVVGAKSGKRGTRLLGTMADRLLRRTTVPVLVVRPEMSFPPRRVLYAVDLSEVSAGALRIGLQLVQASSTSPEWQEALYVLDPMATVGWEAFSPEQVERFATEELHRIVVRSGGAHLPARVVLGRPRETLHATIESCRPDLVVLGTHGRRGIERLLLGSVAQAILDGSPCSALVVPPEAAQHALDEPDRSADWLHVSDEACAGAGVRRNERERRADVDGDTGRVGE